MNWVYIEDIGKHVGEEIAVRGWVYNLRSSGKIKFLIVRDGTGVIQCVVTRHDSEQAFGEIDRLTQESSVIVHGVAREEGRAPGGYELTVSRIEIVSVAESYPITPKEHGVDFLLNKRHLWLRSSRQHSVLRVRAEVMKACRDYLDGQGFIEVTAPIFTPSASEGTTTLFETRYFDGSAYLSQSGQLYNEAAAMAFGRVYCFGPTFRAEKSKTRRHLTEFWMLEPEMAYADLETVFEISEGLVAYVVGRVLENRRRELEVLERDVALLERIVPPFGRMSYDEALENLRAMGFDVDWGSDLGAEEETVLSKSFDRPTFIHDYPAEAKSFYMEPTPGNERTVRCTDLIAPEGVGEIIGGSERISDLALLEKRIDQHGLPREAFEWYLDLRKYGSVPHAGFGLGLERTVAWICGIKHIREAMPFPRMIHRVYP
ncbi:MAG: asparagine--tRNA ligase [bacterium]